MSQYKKNLTDKKEVNGGKGMEGLEGVPIGPTVEGGRRDSLTRYNAAFLFYILQPKPKGFYNLPLSVSRNKAPLRNAAGILLSTLVGRLLKSCLKCMRTRPFVYSHICAMFTDSKESVSEMFFNIPQRCWKVPRA